MAAADASIASGGDVAATVPTPAAAAVATTTTTAAAEAALASELPEGMDPLDFCAVLHWFLRRKGAANATLIFAMITGSTAWNLNDKEGLGSDIDYMAVYASDTAEHLSLYVPPEAIGSLPGEKPDISCHEVRKFLRQLIRGNPAAIEALWVDELAYQSAWWQALRQRRRLFLTGMAVREHVSFAEKQMRLMAARQGPAPYRKPYHIVRHLLTALRIAQGRDPQVRHPRDSPEWAELMAIRRKQTSHEQVRTRALQLIAEIAALAPYAAIPDAVPQADVDRLELWLIDLRRQLLAPLPPDP